MNSLVSFLDWLGRSSADPKQASLTIKGVLLVAGGYLLQLLVITCSIGVLCVDGLDQQWLSNFVENVVKFVELVLYAIGSVAAVVGLIRKLQLRRWAAPRR